MDNILKDSFSSGRRLCPYKDKCYRKNPIHFNEMSHPHLEKLIINQLDSPITIPNDINFKCTDKSLLLDQLTVLQMVLNKYKNINSKSQTIENNINPLEKTNTNQYDVKKLKDLEVNNKAIKLDLLKSEKDALIRKRASSNNIDNISESHINPIYSFYSNIDMQSFNQNSSPKKSSRHKIHLCVPGEFALKYALSSPYYFFLTFVEQSESTHKQEFTISFPELLDISLGEIVDSLHINFIVEIGWLCLQYVLAAQNPNMTIFCGSVCDPQTSLPANINLILVNMPSAYGCHHSKISVIKYSDNGIRIVISTANIYKDDWENRTQGIWLSPHLSQLPDSANSSDGDSPTEFKKYFIKYLTTYKQPQMKKWEHLIKRADFSAVNVFFLASTPGSHKSLNLNSWGHRRLSTILSEHAVLPPDASKWTLLLQCSSIGSLGSNYEDWLLPNIVASMSKDKAKEFKSNPNCNLIYPSLKNYIESFDYKTGSCCLPYTKKNHEKQKWLKKYLHQWRAEENSRTKAMPHIKSYTRISPDCTQIPWFVLTSANLSKSAWGTTAKSGISHYIMNYEAGIVFIPKFIITQTTFPIRKSNSSKIPVFRLPYDLPLTQYQPSDTPFVIDFLSN
ncbi:PREDICTED: probable tyrosyl-DNA phosphodiesterase [Ceratosolen solmsi marchali]|uniref:Probable tyrosyl-DNA phosphodiesterase n=1 Tax=Ceratosolen solmsi marchali TaxID=326594 RepID=A0AAJ7E0W9_9HYME|nr:PREDICTED: probable tyrosyl-DNA phosphodiesterase [Ceratosolen solmsi marchali]